MAAEQNNAAERDLLDEEGENLAVRAFLLYYGGGNAACPIISMRAHLARSGFDGCWPAWAAAPNSSTLTKSGAQLWLRHLFALEGRRSAAIGDGGLPELMEAFGTMENADEDGHTIGWVPGYTASQMRGYALDAIAADRRARGATLEKSPGSDDKLAETRMATGFGDAGTIGMLTEIAPQAAQGVKTWQERVDESGMRGTEHACMMAEIADLRSEVTYLRVQLARQSQSGLVQIGELVELNDGFGVEPNTIFVDWNAERYKLPVGTRIYAAPPLSSEQQAQCPRCPKQTPYGPVTCADCTERELGEQQVEKGVK
jgi:hypothetical protein